MAIKRSQYTSEITNYCRRKNNDGFRLKFALKNQERKDLIKECGVYGLIIFEYYLRMASIGNVVLTDEGAASYFGLTANAVKKHRINLQKKGWFYRDSATSGDKRRIHIYYLGKEEVAEARREAGLPPLETNE